MNEDAGVRWLTLSKAVLGEKEQQNKQHCESLLLESIQKQDKV